MPFITAPDWSYLTRHVPIPLVRVRVSEFCAGDVCFTGGITCKNFEWIFQKRVGKEGLFILTLDMLRSYSEVSKNKLGLK